MGNLKIKNLHMHFSGVRALDDVSFGVNEGEIYSLIGPNGSGKSTLFNCINGFCKPQQGSMIYNNINLKSIKPHEIVKEGISRTFQNLQNVPYMTLLENVLLGAHRRLTIQDTINRWLSQKEREREESLALEIMDFLGIANFEKKYLSGQPYGIQKLVEIARALICKPKLILMDEPAAGMNDQETLEIAKIITEIRDILGITVLVVEHDMKLVMSISDQICVLDSGKILALGKPDEVKNHPDVIKVFLGDEAHA
jgi:branched-chain amino acid transport system ATP-binding protein